MDTGGYAYNGECLAVLSASNPTTSPVCRDTFVSWLSNGFRLNRLESLQAFYALCMVVKGPQAAIASLTTQTDTTTDIVASGLAFAPELALFASHCKALSTQDTAVAIDEMSIGAATSTTERGAHSSLDENGTGNAEITTAIEYDAVYINLTDAGGSVSGLMDVKSFDSGGITCIMDDADPAAAFVGCLLIGPAAAAGITGDGAGAVVVSGSATGTVAVAGTGTGALPITGSATGAVAVAGDGTAAVVLVGTGTGAVAILATGDAVVTLTGAGTGTVGAAPITGDGAGVLVVVGAATGGVQVAGAGAAPLVLVGSATGAVGVGGAGAGILVLVGTAAGSVSILGAGAANLVLAGTAAGFVGALFGPSLLVTVTLTTPTLAGTALVTPYVADVDLYPE